ncbi:hypothetical protein ACFVMC_28435 [Nocardia sp. NPDC127579]|uniref:hypothetical protein n=1 Tax=Nocardia sp. NPDC127579 TaxID=3345402 RepID=UPI003642F378
MSHSKSITVGAFAASLGGAVLVAFEVAAGAARPATAGEAQDIKAVVERAFTAGNDLSLSFCASFLENKAAVGRFDPGPVTIDELDDVKVRGAVGRVRIRLAARDDPSNRWTGTVELALVDGQWRVCPGAYSE